MSDSAYRTTITITHTGVLVTYGEGLDDRLSPVEEVIFDSCANHGSVPDNINCSPVSDLLLVDLDKQEFLTLIESRAR